MGPWIIKCYNGVSLLMWENNLHEAIDNFLKETGLSMSDIQSIENRS